MEMEMDMEMEVEGLWFDCINRRCDMARLCEGEECSIIFALGRAGSSQWSRFGTWYLCRIID
jgi:hypothetical protein